MGLFSFLTALFRYFGLFDLFSSRLYYLIVVWHQVPPKFDNLDLGFVGGHAFLD